VKRNRFSAENTHSDTETQNNDHIYSIFFKVALSNQEAAQSETSESYRNGKIEIDQSMRPAVTRALAASIHGYSK
jgi:hypothetical protein